MMTIEMIAEVCHNVNKAYCESIGDFSQVKWDEAEEWQRDSAFEGVKAHLANPNLTPKDSHDSWLTHKLVNGWKYGAKKDPVSKEHPCMLPYDLLPQYQRSKDYIFKAVMDSLRKYNK